MQNQFSRTEILLGTAAMERLARARVAVFGLGGVGGYVVEALVRSGVGALDLIDNDRICLSNLNRQIIATRQTVGAYKVDAAAARVHDINPQCRVQVYRTFYLPETAAQFDFTQYDYVVDTIDTVSGKLQLAEEAYRTGTPIISCMGAGNKVHPELFEVADIYETSVCPLARVMRRELKRRGDSPFEGGLFQGKGPHAPDTGGARLRRAGERSPRPGGTRRIPPRRPRQHRLCPRGSGDDSGRRGGKGAGGVCGANGVRQNLKLQSLAPLCICIRGAFYRLRKYEYSRH